MSGPRPRRVRWLGPALAVAAAGCLAALASLPLRVRRVVVTGARRFSPAEVIAAAGVAPGDLVGPADARRIERALARRPNFAAATVIRGLAGTLHVRVVERAPVAWLPAAGCAVAADGVLLDDVRARGTGWPALAGLDLRGGRLAEPARVAEGLALAAAAPAGTEGVWTLAAGGAAWEWTSGGRRIRCSSPPQPEEFSRLKRFQEAFPDAWARARAVDLRFKERVVTR